MTQRRSCPALRLGGCRFRDDGLFIHGHAPAEPRQTGLFIKGGFESLKTSEKPKFKGSSCLEQHLQLAELYHRGAPTHARCLAWPQQQQHRAAAGHSAAGPGLWGKQRAQCVPGVGDTGRWEAASWPARPFHLPEARVTSAELAQGGRDLLHAPGTC